jgi:ferredoxin
MAHQVEFDRELCIGAGQCLLASSLFELADDGKVDVLRSGIVTDDEVDEVEDAVSLCPVEALVLRRDAVASGDHSG